MQRNSREKHRKNKKEAEEQQEGGNQIKKEGRPQRCTEGVGIMGQVWQQRRPLNLLPGLYPLTPVYMDLHQLAEA